MYNNQNQNGQNGNGRNYPPHNMCQNFWLRCNSMRTNRNNTVTLNCMLYAKKKQDGSYPATMFISVYCDVQKGCQMPAIDFTGKVVSVSGSFSVDSYFNQRAGGEVPQYTIFADTVQVVQFENNGGGSHRNNSRNNGGNYQRNNYQNNGYQNGSYGQNNGYAQQNSNYQNSAYGQNGGYPNQNYQNGGFPQNQPMNQPPQPPQNYQNNGFQPNQPMNMNQSPQAPAQQNMPAPQQNYVPQSAPQENASLADFETIIDENGNVPF